MTEGYKRLQGVPRGSKGAFKRGQGITRDDGRLQGVTVGYRGCQGVTRGYRR